MDKDSIRKKLLMEKASTHLILNLPAHLKDIFHEADSPSTSKFEFVILFAHSLGELRDLMVNAISRAEIDSIFWACYPKGTSKLKSDIKRSTLFNAVEEFGVRPVAQVSIDETWSAMRVRPHDRVGTAKK